MSLHSCMCNNTPTTHNLTAPHLPPFSAQYSHRTAKMKSLHLPLLLPGDGEPLVAIQLLGERWIAQMLLQQWLQGSPSVCLSISCLCIRHAKQNLYSILYVVMSLHLSEFFVFANQISNHLNSTLFCIYSISVTAFCFI